MTRGQLSGLLSGLAGISILVASYFSWYRPGYNAPIPKVWPRVLLAVLIAALLGSLVALFWPLNSA